MSLEVWGPGRAPLESEACSRRWRVAFGDSSVEQEYFLSGQKLRCYLWTLVSVHRGTPHLLGGHFPTGTLIPNAAQNPRKRQPLSSQPSPYRARGAGGKRRVRVSETMEVGAAHELGEGRETRRD